MNVQNKVLDVPEGDQYDTKKEDDLYRSLKDS